MAISLLALVTGQDQMRDRQPFMLTLKLQVIDISTLLEVGDPPMPPAQESKQRCCPVR